MKKRVEDLTHEEREHILRVFESCDKETRNEFLKSDEPATFASFMGYSAADIQKIKKLQEQGSWCIMRFDNSLPAPSRAANGITMKTITRILDMRDVQLVAAVTEAARDAGFNEIQLLDRGFVLSALEHERDRMVGRGDR